MSGVEAVFGLALALPPIIESIVKLIETVTKRMEQSKNMKDFVQHLRGFVLETGQIRLKQDMELGKRILKDPSTSRQDTDRLNALFKDAMRKVREIESNVTLVLEKADTLFSRKKRVALAQLSEQTRDLELLLNTFHDMVISLNLLQCSDSLLLLTDYDFAIVGRQDNRRYLNSGSFITTGRLSKATTSCTTEVQDFLFESKSYEQLPVASVKKNLELLSQHLVMAQVAGGIPQLLGFREDPSTKEFQLVFQIDQSTWKGENLLHKFHVSQDMPSLNFRINLCAHLAEAILHVHTLKLVHKNVRPENILLVPEAKTGNAKLFLLGWQYARQTENFQTWREGELCLDRRIYQHPQRNMQHAEHDYCMAHDIYSLGVCLLEILTWTPLLHPTEEGKTVASPAFKEAFNEVILSRAGSTTSRFQDEEDRMAHRPLEIQLALIAIAKAKIPSSAGERMAGILHKCLTCLESEEGLGGGTDGQGQIDNEKEVGADFVDAVLKDIRVVYSAI